ncbi:hypothetical protein [Streptomyces endophyticus]|uniref:Uncharacterized protein n=1 Tax=Streptomyces endophyticus TaxID=714166 RepID=A0ABU6FEK5_9ACTN|nr:hypothetical protein [Streptomyces endophyticus]MEB8342363.1 hypothetical protein [Streptomyces endophyticus]
MTIQFLVEGNGFESAARELAALDGMDDKVELVRGDPTQKEPVLLTVAAIVSITAGSAALVEQIMKWRRRWQGRPDCPHQMLMLVDGRRLALETLDEETLARRLAPVDELDD